MKTKKGFTIGLFSLFFMLLFILVGTGTSYSSGCEDTDGDGIPEELLTDSSGASYCLSVDPVTAIIVGEPVSIVINAYHEDGINRIWLIRDSDYINGKQEMFCSFDTTCVFETTISQDFEGSSLLEIVLWRYPNSYSAEQKLVVNFECRDLYCQPDPYIANFVQYSRGKGYKECVIDKYVEWSADPEAKAIIKRYLGERDPSQYLEQVNTINFYDVIPTDPEATFLSLGEGEGGNCQANPYWPDWCPDPVPADYKFIESHFERTFGVEFNFIYHRVEIDYTDTFGVTFLNGSYRFGSRYNFIYPFDVHSIVHYAIQSYNGKAVWDMTGGNYVCEISYEPYNALGITTYTHEFGHTFVLPHPFYGTTPRKFVQLDGIMSNTYTEITNMIDPMDPLERFALEPVYGYLDDPTFADEYYNGILGSYHLLTCETADPALLSINRSTSGNILSVDLSMSNNGNLGIGYVPLSVYVDTVNSSPIETRIIKDLSPAITTTHQFEFDLTQINGTVLYFVLDPEHNIAENNPDNDQLSLSINGVAPVASAGADQTINDANGTGEETVTLDGTATYDPDGRIDYYLWKEGTTTLGTGAVITPSLTVGTHNITLTVTYNDNASSVDQVTVTVNPNQSPKANAGLDQVALTGDTISFDGSGSSDADGSITTYNWDFGDETTGTDITPTHIYAAAGTYIVALAVTDNGGAADTDTVQVTINSAGPSLHVQHIDMSARERRNRWKATAQVIIVDSSDTPIKEAVVYGTWSGDVSGSVSKTTNRRGKVKITSDRVSGGGTFTFTVTDVVKSGYVYDSASNGETSDFIVAP